MSYLPTPTNTWGVEVAIQWNHCPECGVLFGMTQFLFQQRMHDESPIFCPNGHECVPPSPTKEPPAPEPAKRSLGQRRELVALMHRAEQAEAKAADLSARAEMGGVDHG